MWKTSSRRAIQNVTRNQIVSVEFLPEELNRPQTPPFSPLKAQSTELMEHSIADHQAFLRQRKQHDHNQCPSHSFFNSSTMSDDQLCSLSNHCCIS